MASSSSMNNRSGNVVFVPRPPLSPSPGRDMKSNSPSPNAANGASSSSYIPFQPNDSPSSGSGMAAGSTASSPTGPIAGIPGVHRWDMTSADDTASEERSRLRDWQRACELATEWERWWMLRQQTSAASGVGTSQAAVGTHRPRLKSYQGGVPVGTNPRWIVEPALAASMPPPSSNGNRDIGSTTAPASLSSATNGNSNNGSMSARDAHRQAFVESLHRRLALDESHTQQNEAIAATMRRDRAYRRAQRVMRAGAIPRTAKPSGNGVSNGGSQTARVRALSAPSPTSGGNGGVNGPAIPPSPGGAPMRLVRALPPPIVERSSSDGTPSNGRYHMPQLPTPQMPFPPHLTTPAPVAAPAPRTPNGTAPAFDHSTASGRRAAQAYDDYHYAMSYRELERLITGHPLAPARAASIAASVGGGGRGPGSHSRAAVAAAYSGRLLAASPLKYGTVRNDSDGLYYSAKSAVHHAQVAASIYTPRAVTAAGGRESRSPTRGTGGGSNDDDMNFRAIAPAPVTHVITPQRSTANMYDPIASNSTSINEEKMARLASLPPGPESPAPHGFISITPASPTGSGDSSASSSPVEVPHPIPLTASGRPMTRADIPASFPLDKLQAATPGGKLPLAILVACGSYSPVTFLHLAVLETARNYLQFQMNQYEVVGGYMSPVHDGYGKSSLIPAHHRLAMVERCTESSEWIDRSSWELEQSAWTRTAVVLAQYQKFIDASGLYDRPVRVMFLCGTDILESFLVPNLWSDDDIQTILHMGLACLQRQGSDGHAIITKAPLLNAAKDRIVIIPQRIENTISSTEVRRNLQNNATIKYLTPDPVIDYIATHSLYSSKPRSPVPPILASPAGGTRSSPASTIPPSFPLDKLWQPSSTDGRPLAVLIACGSYSPVTYLHLAVFETARNFLQFENSMFEVVGGYMSPTHDAYGKASLIDQRHRVEMCRRACATSEWVATSSWETEQKAWSPTAQVLAQYQSYIEQSKLYSRDVRTLFLCGTDVLESFLVPKLWAEADQEYILTRGVACIQRAGVDGVKLVADNPQLCKYKDSIWIIPQRITNTISSTEVRTNIKMNQTVKYLTPDDVIKYIYDQQLYGSSGARRMSTATGVSGSPSFGPTALSLLASSSVNGNSAAAAAVSPPGLLISNGIIPSPHGLVIGTDGRIVNHHVGSVPPSPGVTPGTRLRSSLPVPASFHLTKIRRIKKLATSGLPLAVLVSCGTFSPVVNQNLAMFEAARNYLSFETKRFEVVGGILSPVHDSYAKSGADPLLPSGHRTEMLRLATATSDWLNFTTWETEQPTWTRTAVVLSTYQRFLNDAKVFDQPIRVLLLCTSEFLQSVAGTWSEADTSLVLGRVGVVCVRLPAERAAAGADALTVDELGALPTVKKYEENIWVVPQALPCTGSSILLRQHLANGWSAKYMAPDSVLDYLGHQGLFPPPLTQSSSTTSTHAHAANDTTPSHAANATAPTSSAPTK